MAGEIQEPFRLHFQLDSIHSGSISFGRFETEPLSWERRSSFSHNRYLEEVKKYSRPGSVTEKKAYFEAHFKRKALLSQSSSDFQNSTGYQTNENDTSEYTGFTDEYEHNNGSGHSDRHERFDDGVGDSVHYDESYGGSEHGGDSEVMKSEVADRDTSCVGIQFDIALQDRDVEYQHEPSANDVSSVGIEHVNGKDEDQSLVERFCETEDVQGEQVIEKHNEKTLDVELTCKVAHPSADIQCNAKNDSPRQDNCNQSCQKSSFSAISRTP